MSIRRAGRDLYVEIEYSRDRIVDLRCGGWASFPQPPDASGDWHLWHSLPDRKSGWLRIWAKRGSGSYVHEDRGHA